LSLEWTDRISYIRRPASDFRSRKQSDFPKWLRAATFISLQSSYVALCASWNKND